MFPYVRGGHVSVCGAGACFGAGHGSVRVMFRCGACFGVWGGACFSLGHVSVCGTGHVWCMGRGMFRFQSGNAIKHNSIRINTVKTY